MKKILNWLNESRTFYRNSKKTLIVTFEPNADCDHHGYLSWGAEEPIAWCDGTTVFNLPEQCKNNLLDAGIVNDDRDACAMIFNTFNTPLPLWPVSAVMT
jgi:hypothetical protein